MLAKVGVFIHVLLVLSTGEPSRVGEVLPSSHFSAPSSYSEQSSATLRMTASPLPRAAAQLIRKGDRRRAEYEGQFVGRFIGLCRCADAGDARARRTAT